MIGLVEVVEFRVDDEEIVSEPLCPSFPKTPPFTLSCLHDSNGDGLHCSLKQIHDMWLLVNSNMWVLNVFSRMAWWALEVCNVLCLLPLHGE